MDTELALETITIQCPHCYAENPAFGSARCQNCQLSMRSDQEQAHLQKTVLPTLKELMAFSSQENPTWKGTRENLRRLEQLDAYREQYPFLRPPFEGIVKDLQGVFARYRRRKQLQQMSLMVLALLILAPLIGWWLKMDGWVLVFLILPVPAWLAMVVLPVFFQKRL